MTLPETWTNRDRRVLEFVLQHADTGTNEVIGIHEISKRLPLSQDQVFAALTSLAAASPPYIELEYLHVMRVCERARRELGTWPSADTVVAQLAEALLRAADEATEPERKNRLRAAGESLVGIGRDIAVQTVGTMLGNST